MSSGNASTIQLGHSHYSARLLYERCLAVQTCIVSLQANKSAESDRLSDSHAEQKRSLTIAIAITSCLIPIVVPTSIACVAIA